MLNQTSTRLSHEAPVGFRDIASDLSRRMIDIFLRDESGRRPVWGGAEKFQSDPHWRDELLFYEYFHGDNGAGLGASHQTGWTGVVARMIQLFGSLDAQAILREGGRPLAIPYVREPSIAAARKKAAGGRR